MCNVFIKFNILFFIWVLKFLEFRYRLAIRGGSNGGLLVGAVSQQRPDLFGAVVNQVGYVSLF